MTGAGSGSFAIAPEDSFLTLPDIPTWYHLGENQNVGDASFDRQLIDVEQGNDARGNGSVEGNRLGTFSISFTYAGTNWHEFVFPATGPVGLTDTGLAPTATIYLASDLPDGTTQERFLAGASVTSFSLSYSEGGVVEVELTFEFYDEPEVGGTHGTAPADGDIQKPAKTDIVTAAGFDFELAGASIDNLQEVTVDIGNMSTARDQQSQTPSDVVVGNYEQTASVTAILSDNNLREATYGESAAVAPVSEVEETTATVTCEARDGTSDEYNLTRVQPANTSWASVLSNDEQTTNPTDLRYVDLTVTP